MRVVFHLLVNLVSDAWWTYPLIFGVAMVDAFFPVVPSETVAITSGVLAASGKFSLPLCIVAAAAGAFAGDNISYGLGHWLGEHTIKRLIRSEKAQRGFVWAEKMLEERGTYLIVVARFIPGGRTAATFSSGYVQSFTWRRFVAADALAATIWGSYAVLLGYVGGKAFEDHPWKGLSLAMGLAIAITVGVEGVRHFRRRRRRWSGLYVTGATGYLGAELVRRAPGATSERVDVRDAEAVRAAFDRLRPRLVIHTAYRQDGEGGWETTVDGAENVARAANEVGARLVHLSTDVVFDGLKGAPYVEDDALCPVTGYGRAKAEAEDRVLAACPDALVVRTSLIVGGPGFTPSKHEQVALDPGMTFYEDEFRCPIQVGDLVAALLELAELEVSGVLHVAGADAVSRAELAELVAGRPVRRAPAPPGRPLDCALDSSRARALLRTELRGVRTVLA